MCTLALYFRVFPDYPLVIAANRDEHYDRPSAPPALVHANPKIVAGKDLRAGGTWLGVNSYGVIAGILNRRSNNEQTESIASRSRGLLCLDLLTAKTTSEAFQLLRKAESESYQPFTVVFANRERASAAYNRQSKIEALEITAGVHVFSNSGDFDEQSEKVTRVYGLFAALIRNLTAGNLEPDGLVEPLHKILSDHSAGITPTGDPRDAICVHGNVSGTVSASILVYSRRNNQFHTFYCPGAPCQNEFSESIRLPLQ